MNFDGTGRLESGINKKTEGTDSGSDKSKEDSDAAFDQLLAASRPQVVFQNHCFSAKCIKKDRYQTYLSS